MIIRIISYLLYVLIAGAATVLFLDRQEIPAVDERIHRPCAEPVTYRIAEIDERFGLSEDELQRFLHAAGKLWSDAAGAGRQLFEYDPDGAVAVHLIYDERQELIRGESDLAGRIQAERMVFERLHGDYIRHSEGYDEALSAYRLLHEEYEKKVDAHNRQVEEWTGRGLITDEQKQTLLDSEAELDRLKAGLIDYQKRVNEAAGEAEERSRRLNEITERKDALIREYNERFAGEHRFNQGEYIDRNGEQRINIYHYQSLNHLRLVLAHEFGHALRLGHVESPESVMYPVVESRGETEVRLSGDDVAAVLGRCSSVVSQ